MALHDLPLWCLDAGNTTVKFGLFRRQTLENVYTVPRGAWPESAQDLAIRAEELSHKHGRAAGLACSTARTEDQVYLGPVFERIDLASPPEFLGPDSPLPFQYVYTSGQPGPDRLANAVALALLSPGRAAIAADFGTATHLEIVDEKGGFRGGTIMPGIRLQFEALSPATGGRLPLLNDEEAASQPGMLAQSTVEAIRTGVLLGQAGAIERFVEDAGLELQAKPDVYLTGGGARRVAPLLRIPYTMAPHLTLRGLASWWRFLREES